MIFVYPIFYILAYGKPLQIDVMPSPKKVVLKVFILMLIEALLSLLYRVIDERESNMAFK